MKIYTQTGDTGKTSLLSGERVSKNHLRIRAYGEVDELSSAIGALVAALYPSAGAVRAQLQDIQSDLFQASAWLSAGSDPAIMKQLTPFDPDHIHRLETWIDGMDAKLPPLRAFILPGGAPAAAWSNMARTVCRRAERQLLAVIETEGCGRGLDDILAYLNRLSDYFFVLARYLNQQAGEVETQWKGGKSRKDPLLINLRNEIR